MKKILEQFIKNYISVILEEENIKPRFFNGNTEMVLDHPNKGKEIKSKDNKAILDSIIIEYDWTKDFHKKPITELNFQVGVRWIIEQKFDPEDDYVQREIKKLKSWTAVYDLQNNQIKIENYKSIFKDKPELSEVIFVDAALRKFVDTLRKNEPEKFSTEIDEFNAVGTGAITGYILPFGMSPKSNYKVLWSGDKKKKTKKKKYALQTESLDYDSENNLVTKIIDHPSAGSKIQTKYGTTLTLSAIQLGTYSDLIDSSLPTVNIFAKELVGSEKNPNGVPVSFYLYKLNKEDLSLTRIKYENLINDNENSSLSIAVLLQNEIPEFWKEIMADEKSKKEVTI